ncbi:MAG: hypothetical protein GY794_08080 [bacterium]|nr:hypothetical protein [bacterium]
MRKILTTADPPLRFLVINDHTEYQKRLNKKTGKMVKVIVGSYPIPIPKNKSSNSSSFGI